ncbi:MAG: OsmC family protein [Bacteroidota bacterium]
MKIQLNRLDDHFHFEMTSPDGHIVQTDASVENDGKNKASRPTDLLLMSLAACSSYDVVKIMQKMKVDLKDIKVEVDGEKDRTEVPALFRKIHIKYQLFGDIPLDKAQRAVDLSISTYCSVSKTLEKIADITYEVGVVSV